jgi:hypothetical protein
VTQIIKDLAGTCRLTPARLVNVLWESAIDAFVKSIVLLVMGSIALELMDGIFGEMAPSRPSFLVGDSGPGATSNSSILHRWWASAHEHQFLIIFAILFVLCLRTRLVPAVSGGAGQPQLKPTRVQKLSSQLSKEWFRLFVGNAFGALISAIVIYFAETFTGTRFLFNLLLAAVAPTLKAIAAWVFGATVVNFVGGFFDWYGDNQLKFNFWILYIAAVCDDLGLPNLKTLARFAWSRWRRKPLQHQNSF